MKATQTTSMMMIATLVGALLLFMASPAAAEDVNECATSPEDTGVEACIVDTTDGDKDTACQGADGEGTYHGETSVSAEADTEAGGGTVGAEGVEDCKNSPFNRNRDHVRTETRICLIPAHGTIHGNCYHTNFVHLTWKKDSAYCCGLSFIQEDVFVYTSMRNGDAGFSSIRATYGETYGEGFPYECTLSVSPNTEPPLEDVEQPCPAGIAPGAPPNPGWGNVTP